MSEYLQTIPGITSTTMTTASWMYRYMEVCPSAKKLVLIGDLPFLLGGGSDSI